MLSLSRELLGKSIGSYHLNKLIGIGGTGAVFLGNGDDGSEMAVKILIPPILVSEESLKEFHKRFQREAEILSQLKHPHILPVKDFGTDETSGFPYMIMPYKNSGTLVEQIQGGPLPFDRVMKYVWQLAQALTYAHEQNIIHRDIKPANVLLDEQDQTSLADFSIAKLFNLSTTTLTSANQMLGTPAYMAPEQVSNQPVSPATDIYGLGVLTYQLITGTLPFDVSVLLALLQRIIQENPPPAHGIRTDLPPAASDVLLKALAKQPEKRFASAEDFARALEESMQTVLVTSAIMHAAKEQWLASQAVNEACSQSNKGIGSGVDELADEVEVDTNEPTLVAHYETSPLEDEQAALLGVDHDEPPAIDGPASSLSSVARSAAPGPEEDHSTLLLLDQAPPKHKKTHLTSPNTPLPLESSASLEEREAALPTENEPAPSLDPHEEEHSEDPTPQLPFPPRENSPLATQQQESIAPAEDERVEAEAERVEALATVVALQPPLEAALSSLTPAALEAVLASMDAPAVEASIVNQPSSRYAAIVKPHKRLQLQLKRPWPRWQILVAAVLTLLLLSEGVFSLYASGHGLFAHQNKAVPTPVPPATAAIIGITPDTRTLQQTFTIMAVTGLPDANKHQVLARWIANTTQPLMRTTNATGKVSNPATPASGTLLFTNASFAGGVNIPAGTKLNSQGKHAGVQVVLDEPVSLPAAPLNYVNPNQRPTQRVRAHFATGGAAGNITPQQFSIVSGACVPTSPVCFSALNDASFIGGTDAQNYTFVQQSDIDGAASALQAQAPDAQQFLQGQLSTSEQWIITPACKPQTTANHAANDRATNVTITVIFTCSGESFDRKGAMEAAKQELTAQAAKNPGPDYVLHGAINTKLKDAQVADASGNVNVTVDTKGAWTFQLSDAQKQDLMKNMAGKKKLAVQGMLKGLKGIKNATIQLQDGDENTFPDDPQHITINTTAP